MTQKKYDSKPDQEILGASVKTTIDNMPMEDVKPILDSVTAKYGVKEITEQQWYPLSMIMEIYKKMAEHPTVGPNFTSIGMKVMDAGFLPPEINSIVGAVNVLNAASSMTTKNCDATRYYVVNQVDDHHVKVEENTPFPHDLLYGFIYSLARRFRPQGATFKVVRTYMDPATPDNAGGIYEISWS